MNKDNNYHILLVDDDEEEFILLKELIRKMSDKPGQRKIRLDWVSNYDRALESLRNPIMMLR